MPRSLHDRRNRSLRRHLGQPWPGLDVDDLGFCAVDSAVPAAAERLVEGDVVGRQKHAALQQGILGRIERALGVEHVEQAGLAGLVERAFEARRLAGDVVR